MKQTLPEIIHPNKKAPDGNPAPAKSVYRLSLSV
jgi:hypothetical protein